MANLRNIISQNNGLRFMVEELTVCSSAGRRMLLSQEMMTNARKIEEEFNKLEVVVEIVSNESSAIHVEKLRHTLSQLRDIHGTLSNLANESVLDDIGLFEIKHFSLLNETARQCLSEVSCTVIDLPDLQHVFDMLDPEKQGIAHFYIYPAYSSELAGLRKRQQILLQTDPEQAEVLRYRCMLIEDSIRQHLSTRLLAEKAHLLNALEQLAMADILFAKAIQAVNYHCCKPQTANKTTEYQGLFNPFIGEALQLQQKVFQPVDIRLDNSPCVITGANMAGKTVLLKTVALSQYLFQFGFYIPAASALVVPVDDILHSMGDEQSELSGLSSFASEMLKINHIVAQARAGQKLLALIDEPARTTNPEEGRAIVNALTFVLSKLEVRSLITTHYSNITTVCRKLRVKGLVLDQLKDRITVANINNYMDYTLLEHEADDVPLEALRIASILGVDDELVEQAGRYLTQN